MSTFDATADAFVDMAHRIVWATVATVDGRGRPRSRILHPYWRREGDDLVGYIATGPTPVKRANLEHSPFVSVNYWSPNHDTCNAECTAEWLFDDTQHATIPPGGQADGASFAFGDKETVVAESNPSLDLDQGRGQSVDRLPRRSQYIEG